MEKGEEPRSAVDPVKSCSHDEGPRAFGWVLFIVSPNDSVSAVVVDYPSQLECDDDAKAGVRKIDRLLYIHDAHFRGIYFRC